MSTFSQFTGGNRIKAIQRGVITLPASTTTATATIASVDPTKTELRMLGHSGSALARISLTSSTQITANRNYDPNVAYIANVSWELTEFF